MKSCMKRGLLYTMSAIMVFAGFVLMVSMKTNADNQDGNIITVSPTETKNNNIGDLDIIKESTGKEDDGKENVKDTSTTSSKKSKKPGRTKVVSAVRANTRSAKAKINLKKVKGVSGYQVKYSYNKKFKKSKTKTKIFKKNKFTLKKLKLGKRYYIKARTYVKKGKQKVYGDWSKRKTVKLKRK